MQFLGRKLEPAYAGSTSFCKAPLVVEPSDLYDADVAILGAPVDEGVTNRPGTRYGPRAIRQADNFPLAPPSRPHLGVAVDPFQELRVVDYGDAECLPGNLRNSHHEIERRVLEILATDTIPVVLGGDHSIAYPDISALASHYGPGSFGVIHFDTHADTAQELWGSNDNHGVPMRRVVQDGFVAGTDFLQFGLRGYFPDPPDWAWMRDAGMTWWTMYDIDERGFRPALEELLARASTLPDRIYLTVDVDVLDPAFAPGTGTPEPGGLTSRELLYAVRRIGRELPLVGMEIVEVSPLFDPSGITALVAHRLVLEALSGIAARRNDLAAAGALSAVADGRPTAASALPGRHLAGPGEA
jgi:agmatinase